MNDSKLNKKIQFDIENKRLNYVFHEIENQMLEFIEKRKKIAQYILDLRKKNLEEYEDDEDKITEYFDHEAFAKEEAFKIMDRKLRELTILNKTPYFGKANFVDKFGKSTIYIGRFGLNKEGEEEPVIVDWRAPISSIFYAGKLGEISYNAPMGMIKADIISKRQFIIKNSKLVGMFDSSMDVKDEILQMVLSQNAGDKLKDIVMTIQAEQDKIIRQSKNKVVVVNGAAGTGKTTIALHRVAYLLYNFRDKLQDKVLIIGPNSIFMDYISTVLPSLGEVGVRQTTFEDFALDIINLKEKTMNFQDYMEKVLENDKRMRDSIIFKGSLNYIQKLDSLVDKLDYEYFNIEDVKFYDKIIVSEYEIKEMFDNYFKYMPLFRRNKKVKIIIFSKIRDERDRLVRAIEARYKKKKSKMSEEELNNELSNLMFKRKNAIRDVIREVMLIKQKLSWLENEDVVDIYKRFNKDNFSFNELIYDDLAPIIYLKIKLEGIKFKQNIRHVVIDEAQDYSMLQFTVIKELTNCKSFTIVGDSNQRILPVEGEIPMSNLTYVFNGFDMEQFNLLKSYRSTQQIMEYANKFIDYSGEVPFVRNGENVLEKDVLSEDELVDEIISDIKSLKVKGYASIAVICKDIKQTMKLGNRIKSKYHITIFSSEDILYSSGEVIIPSYFAKGLEFDSVILINDYSNYKDDKKLKYVMATRALHELHVYNYKN
ncbi:ATP-dependent DNA helicase [Clostridium fermenticellae]|uniref:ATP-dependent DNA helicase n=1 Tax=Clostridium fermenticellae TaxID=2068654 RepID=A0A386H559_9CLOT|nr:UvrD-helicase domain-containing protein [Clostridium fermenticellae]AYD40849.1 ATP-dependent DNA helicase [Clostridium fermenticellae]